MVGEMMDYDTFVKKVNKHPWDLRMNQFIEAMDKAYEVDVIRGKYKRKKELGMTKEEYLKFHSDMCMKMIETTKRKNADYTGNQSDPFANFTKADELGICSTEQGFLVRLTDKLARIISFVQKGVLEVKDETVEDTLLDMANYCILMAGFIKSRRKDV